MMEMMMYVRERQSIYYWVVHSTYVTLYCKFCCLNIRSVKSKPFSKVENPCALFEYESFDFILVSFICWRVVNITTPDPPLQSLHSYLPFSLPLSVQISLDIQTIL